MHIGLALAKLTEVCFPTPAILFFRFWTASAPYRVALISRNIIGYDRYGTKSGGTARLVVVYACAVS